MADVPVKPPRRTTLYRFYADDDTLLYVGIAGNPGRRFEQHAAEKAWWHTIARSTIHHYDSREEASAAELVAIADEKPLHNIIGNRRQGAPMPVDPTSKTDRMGQLGDEIWRHDSLVGSYFLTDAERQWQGCVVAEPQPGVYLVETFSWVHGGSTNQHLVPLEQMGEWLFYDDAKWMRADYDTRVSYKWQRNDSDG